MSDGQERWHGRTAAEWEEAYRAERQARYHLAAERDEVERVEFIPRSEAEALAEALEEWRAADDEAERDFTDESEARLAKAMEAAAAATSTYRARHPKETP